MKTFKKLLPNAHKMDVDVQAELDRLRSQFPELDWSYCVDDNGTLVPPTWPPEVPLAAPPLRVKQPPATNVQRRGGGHGKTRDMCYVSRTTALPPCEAASECT